MFAGRYRPSTFLTLTLDSYGRVDAEGAAIDPERYDYRRAARDAIHFPALVDRFWQNTRRCVGWEVQYFGTVEPQKRGAPHFHAAIRGAISRAELRSITAATYHQVWWPAHDQFVYTAERLPVWDTRAKGFTDPDTGQPLPTWEQACEELAEPAHVVRFGTQVHVKGILGGTEEAGRHVGYLLVTWNHAAGWSSARRRHHELRGSVARVDGVGGEVAGLGSACAGGRVVGDLDRSGAGAADDRRVRPWVGRVPAGL